MSIRSQYRTRIEYVLIKSFHWWSKKATRFLKENQDLLDQIYATGASPYKAAQFIHSNFGKGYNVK